MYHDIDEEGFQMSSMCDIPIVKPRKAYSSYVEIHCKRKKDGLGFKRALFIYF
jgi:hypothetical protein